MENEAVYEEYLYYVFKFQKEMKNKVNFMALNDNFQRRKNCDKKIQT